MLDDSKIIDLFFERSEQAIMELSAKYGSTCNKISYNILNNYLDAEECVNDAYLAAWNTIPPQIPKTLKGYVFSIVRKLSISKYHANSALKRNSHYDIALDELEACLASSVTVDDEIAVKELSRLLDNFLDTLDKESRIMFVRRYWYSDSVSAVAERFNISNNNAALRLSRIRDKLRKYLRKEGYLDDTKRHI